MTKPATHQGLLDLRAYNEPRPSSWLSMTPSVSARASGRVSGEKLLGIGTFVGGVREARPLRAAAGLLLTALPDVFEKAGELGAAVRGFVRDPLRPARARDAILAARDPSFRIEVEGGGHLEAYHRMSDGAFAIQVYPPKGNMDDALLQLVLPEPGRESEVVLKAHPHGFDARLGFHNLTQARWVLADVSRILAAAVADPELERVRRIAIEKALDRVLALDARFMELDAAVAAHPVLGELELHAALSYSLRPGDPRWDEVERIEREVERLLARDSLPPEIAEQVRHDLAFAHEQEAFWAAERRATSGWSGKRRPTPGSRVGRDGHSV